MTHKLESRLLGEISITSDMQMIFESGSQIPDLLTCSWESRKRLCVYVYGSVTLHSFRKHFFHISAIKAKLPEPHFSVCSIGLK